MLILLDCVLLCLTIDWHYKRQIHYRRHRDHRGN